MDQIRSCTKPWKFRIHFVAFVCISLLFLLTNGCGGGGGGDDGSASNGSSSLTYSGLSTPATITQDNAASLSASAFESGANTMGLSGIAALYDTGATSSKMAKPFLSDITEILGNAVENIDFQTYSNSKVSAATQSESDSFDGTCGGSASYSIQVNTDSGAFSGTLDFNGYCEDGMVINGRCSFSGIINVSTEELQLFTLYFTSITGTDGSESITMNGSIEFSISGSTTSATMNMLLRNDNTSQVYKIENYQMDITEYYGYTEIVINGRFYDPDYGYVDLTTTTPFRVYYSSDYPSSGQFVLAGKDGAVGGPTRARLSAIDEIYCHVDADTNGDGSYDYETGHILWTDLN
ncbi:MAG: hypothetical protein VR64_17790 [Desulfatitalea sp. BRH_c12]|nr:MAG: hypothetical protein VR64_17790 [Desulfatitalea sp. BRH_c12]